MSESVGQRRITVRVRFPRIAFLFAWTVSLALPLAAQSPNGTINGRVVDPSNGVIVAADVLVINDVTGVKYSGKTNDDGIYVVPNLPPGPYRLQVSKVGFKTLIKPDIILNIQDALSINFTLPIGAVFETVTVEGGASMINTTDASVSTVIDETYVENMPLNGRSFQDLILLTPGVVTQTPQANNPGVTGLGMTGEFSVNGQRTESNYYTVDGVSANGGATAGLNMVIGAGPSGSVPTATALGTTQALVSVDDLQEFRVQSSTYSAEYGRNPGGQFAFETKAGANQWHGTAYDYLRNGFFDAQDWFNDYFGTPEPALRQNDFGGTVGGPVEIPHLYNGKDKTFFFFSYEGLRLIAPQASSVTYVPDAALRATAPSPLNEVLNAFPVQSPNGIDDTANGIAQFIGSWSNPSSINSTSVRFDHVVNDKLRLFFRFSEAPSQSKIRETQATGGNPSMSQATAYTSRSYTGGASSLFTSRLGNEFRLNYSSNEVTTHTVIDSFGGSTPVDLAQLIGTSSSSQPEVLLEYGGYFIAMVQQRISAVQRQWNLVDTVDLSWGRNHFKFGIDYRRLTPIATPPSSAQLFLYFSEAAVEANQAFTGGVSTVPFYPLYTNFSAFAQDEWRISPRLSLSLGLRWEVNPSPGVTQGLNAYTVQGASPNMWALAPQGTPLWHTAWCNFAPRLGAAYILHGAPGRETVVRGGGGVFFDTGQQLGSLGFDGPGFQALQFQPGSFPSPAPAPVIVNPPTAPYSAAPVGFPTHLQLPYTLQWNASIEQGLGSSQALTVSYVGSHAARLLREAQISTPNNPNATEFLFVNNGLTSDYDALQIQFRRRLSRGLTGLASYTWSQCIDYGSQNYNLGFQRGDCDFDVRHNLSTAFSYDLAKVGNSRLAQAILRNWGIDDRFTARTGFPVTLLGNPSFDPATLQLVYDGLNLVSGQPIHLYGANCASVLQGLGNLLPGKGCPGGRAINPNAFTAPVSGLGDAPRNFVRGFGAWQMDMAIRRDFPIYERLKLQFRADTFNIFNHPNFGTINANFGQTAFGQATATLANSLGVLSPLYQMGGPRSMQFALKLIF
jgi:hypothetical protein